MAGKPKQPTASAPVNVIEHEICDACHLADAKYKAIHEKHSPLYLCGHHYHKHRLYLLMHHYEVKELNPQ